MNEEIPAGRHTVNWDGTDESGQATASGIYFYILRTDDLTLSRKMTYLK
jgi:flagellar hook assembly protein FlgD